MGDGADARRVRGLAAQHRAPGGRSIRGRRRAGLDALLDAGAVGFKIHEDYGAYPELIDAVLSYADAHDVTVSLHTDGLHESAELEDTVAAIAGRTVHAYHVEGTGGGHVPDLIGLVREANILCSSTTPTLPWGVAAAAEHVADDPAQPRRFVGRARGRGARPGADPPGDDGGRGPAPRARRDRDDQLRLAGHGPDRRDAPADDPARPRHEGLALLGGGRRDPRPRPQPDDPYDDTERVLRYLAKCTIEPAIAHGLAGEVGSLAPGNLADIVLWRPAFFGAKPELVLKGGYPAWGPLGEGNASLDRSEPTRYRPDWGGLAHAAAMLGVTFVSGAAAPGTAAGKALPSRLATRRRLVPVHDVRGMTRADLLWNRAVAPVEVSPVDGRVTLAGRELAVPPVTDVPLSRRYFLR